METEILRGSYLENFKWAKELSELLGNEHPKTRKQWENTNQIASKLQELNKGYENRILKKIT